MAPAHLIGSWMLLAGHVLASAGHHHHHHAHLHRVRDVPLGPLPVPVPTQVLPLDAGRAAQTTPPPSLGDACGQVNDAIVSCASIIPNFNKADSQQIGQCLCCNGDKFRPKLFDGKAGQCASYIKSLAPQSTDAINRMSYISLSARPMWCLTKWLTILQNGLGWQAFAVQAAPKETWLVSAPRLIATSQRHHRPPRMSALLWRRL